MVSPPNNPALGMSTKTATEVGDAMTAAGIAMQVVGTYFAVEAMKDQAKAQESALRHQQTLAGMNASAAEGEALFQLWAGDREQAQSGLRYAAIKASAKAKIASSGVRVGTGSAAEVLASIEYAKETDRISININTVRAANATRQQASNYRTRASALGVAAGNARLASKQDSILPALGSAVGGLGRFAQSYAKNQREERYYSRG
jgi:hypothetical protein